MPKKGSLKRAFASFTRQQEEKKHQKAIQEAEQRKADSLTRPSKRTKHSATAFRTSAETTNATDSQARGPPLPRKRIIQPFQSDDTILIVGEANFSFTLCLLSPPRNHAPSNILATAYDSEKECYSKYPDAEANVKKIRAIARRDDIVVFGVDAGQLNKVKQVTGKTKVARSDDPLAPPASARRWSKVWFGFPHVGAGHKDETRNVLANQLLLIRFLVSVAPYLTDGALPDYAASALGQPRQRAVRADSEEPEEGAAQASDEEDLDIVNAFENGTEAEKEALAASRARQPFRSPARRGSVLITLRNASPYTLWNVATLGKRLPEMLSSIASVAPPLPKGCKKPTLADLDASGLSRDSKPAPAPTTKRGAGSGSGQGRAEVPSRRQNARHYQLWRSFEFEPSQWKGYEHRRTVGWMPGISAGDNEDLLRPRNIQTDPKERASRAGGGECRTWQFGLD